MSFDLLAPHYRWMEWLLAGEKLQRSRIAWLDEVRSCRKVLLVGEGPGKFLAECVRRLPEAEITCVDASRVMLEQARRHCKLSLSQERRVHFIQTTLPQWAPVSGDFDLVVSNFFFDCFTAPQLALIIPQLAKVTAPDVRWLVAEFCEPSGGWRRWRARIILALAYSFFRVAAHLPANQLPPYVEIMEQCGFQPERASHWDCGLITAQLWRHRSIILTRPACRGPRHATAHELHLGDAQRS